MVHDDLSLNTRKWLAGVSLGVLGLLVACTAIIMNLAVWKLRKVAQISFARRLNPWLVALFIFGTSMWAFEFFAAITLFYLFMDNLLTYTRIRALLILAEISTNTVAIIFGIMALIMYRSS